MKLNEAFAHLNAINCNSHTEQKNGLTYLSWAWAWQIFKLSFPLSRYTVYEDANGRNYFTDGQTAWVKTGITLVADDGEIELIEMLPVMDFRNKSIPVGTNAFTSFEVNKTIQRSLTKALARHGLGLYIYAGEDLPKDACDGEAELDMTVKTQKNTEKQHPATVSVSNKVPAEEKPAKATFSADQTNIMMFAAQQCGTDGKGLKALYTQMIADGKLANKKISELTDAEMTDAMNEIIKAFGKAAV